MLLNRDLFVKAWHNRVYSFSSGTKFGQAGSELKKWFNEAKEKWDRLYNEEIGDVDVSTHMHTCMCTHIHTHAYTHTLGGDTLQSCQVVEKIDRRRRSPPASG